MLARSLFQTSDMHKQHELLNRISVLVDNGTLISTVTNNLEELTVEKLKEAHTQQESGRVIGKNVLDGFAQLLVVFWSSFIAFLGGFNTLSVLVPFFCWCSQNTKAGLSSAAHLSKFTHQQKFGKLPLPSLPEVHSSSNSLQFLCKFADYFSQLIPSVS